jgi:hypothetical protein
LGNGRDTVVVKSRKPEDKLPIGVRTSNLFSIGLWLQDQNIDEKPDYCCCYSYYPRYAEVKTHNLGIYR